MKFIEFVFWLTYSLIGFAFLTYNVFLMAARSSVKSFGGPSFQLVQIELLVLANVLIFSFSLQWCLSNVAKTRRLQSIKASAFFLSLVVIFLGGGFIIGSKGVLHSKEFLISVFTAMVPLIVAMIISYFRTSSECDGDRRFDKLDAANRCYTYIVAAILFGSWNFFCFLN